MYYSCNPKTSSSFSAFCIVQCAICKEVLLTDDLIARPNNCLHMYHFICIDEWLKVGFIVCYIFSSDHEEIVRSILLERCLKLDLVTERTVAGSDQERRGSFRLAYKECHSDVLIDYKTVLNSRTRAEYKWTDGTGLNLEHLLLLRPCLLQSKQLGNCQN